MKKAFAFAAVLGVCLAFDDAWALYFTSNSPVPEAKKAYMVFPADVIEGFDTGYRELRSILESHGFNVVQRRPGAGEILYLNDFKLEIGSGEYSAFVANGHAGDAGIAVEIYEDEQMRDSAYQYYLAHGFDDTQIKKFTEKREIWWIFDQPYAWVIAVTPTAIAQWAQFQKGTIASVLTCYSFSRLQDAFVAANASFFVGSVPAFYFADMAKFSTAFWGLIGGFGAYTGSGLPDSLAKRNFAVREAFDQVNGYLWTQAGARNVLGARSADGSCDSERLYNTPRIVSAKLTQSDIYDWTYADQTYPFNEGDYPGDRSAAAKNPAKSGPLGIRLQFSESMDPTWSGFNILLAPQSVGETVDYTNGAWSRTVLDNDTWIGSLTIPESGGLDGQANLVVKARDAFLDDSSSENTDGELDTDGDGAWNGSDFSVAIKIPPPPTLGIDDLYLSFSGTSELKPSTILPNSSEWGLGFAVTDLQSDLASFSVAPALKTNVAFLNGVLQNPPVGAATLPPGTRSISGGMSPVSDTFMPGHYLAAAANVAGRKTLAGFAISTITASAWWNPGTEATYNSTSGGFAVQESLRLTAPIEGLGLHSIEKIDPVNGQSLGYKEISGAEAYQPYSKSLPLTGMVTDRFYVRDTEGNTIFHTINMGADGAGIHDFLPNGGMTCSGDIDNGWSIKTLGGSGSCLSRVYSLSAEFSMLKGAVLLAGDWLNPWTGKTEYVDLIQSLRSLTSEPLENPGPLSEGQKQIGTFVVKMVDVVGGGESTLLSGTIFESPVPPFGTRTWAETVPHIVALPELFKLKLELHSTSPDTVFPWDCDQVNEAGTSCLLGRKRLPQITIAGYPILGVEFYEESGPTRGFEFAAGHTYAGPLGFGVEIGNFTTLQPGEVLSAVANSQPEPGWRSVPKDGTFDLWANGAFFKTPFELRLPFLDASLTSQQRENLRVVRLSGVQREIGPNLNYAVSNGKVSLASVDAFGRFMIMVPQYAGPQKVAANGIEFMSGQAGVTVRQVSVSEPAIVLAGLGAKGLVTVSPIFKLGPDGMSFSPSGVVKMTFSPEQLAVLGLSKDNIAIYQIGPDGSLELLSGQFRAYEGNYISAQVNRFSSYFAVLAQGTVPPSSLLPDVTPPVSGISFQPILSVQEGQTFVSTTSIVSLNAVDPYVADSLVSGVAATFFLLDQPFVSLEATPPTVYASTFALTVGTHAVTYFSQDWAGNLEAPKIASVTVLLADTTPPSTELGFEGYSAVQDDGGVLVTTETRIKLISSDPQVLGAVTSGADKAYYLVDTPFVDFAATPPQVFYASAPFALDPGTHTVTFFSQDLAGNMEEARSAQILVVVPEPAVNPAGQLAVVMRSSGSIGLSWTANGNPPYATYSVNYTVVESSTTCDFVPGPTIKNQFVVGTTASITGLLPGTPYWFTVCPNSLANACAEPVVAVTLSTGSPSQADPPYYSCGSQEPPPSVQYRGLSISADTGGNLWEVIAADSGAQLAKFDVAGAPLASVVLPGSTTEGNWTIRFDPEGNAYAVGGASSGVEEGLQKVAVYKVSSSGDVLLSSTVFENPWGLNDFAFDSAGDIWITGAVQTSGPPDFSGPVGISMGLWRFEPATGQLSLKSSYAGDSGFDAGFGVQLDGSGDIWVVGFSSVAAASGHNKLALALWKYDASGTSLLAGPFLRHGYMRDIEQDVNARLLASGDDLWVTATKTSAVGNLDMALLRYGLDGVLKSEKFWHSDSGGDELPTSILVGRNGAITVAGGTGERAGELAVWRYTSEGVLEWARTMAGAGRANGMVYSGGMWLAAAGSGTPLKFTPGASLAGGEGTDAGGLDVLAPRTTVQIGEPKTPGDPVVVSTATLLSLSAEDDLAVVGDNLGIGVAGINFLIDVTRESCEGAASDPAALQGTCANPVYSQPFTLGPGLHTVYYSAMDLAGHEEPIGSFRATAAEVSVDTTPPVVGLLSPSPLAEGISQLFSGVVQVIGTATDEHLASYALKLSAGESFDPESNTTITESSSSVELGILGLLDTAAVEPGTYTLRLEARDLAGNSTVLDARMYLDVLGVDLVIGQTPGLNHPQGVASGPLGRVWVSDTNNDSLRVFEADGSLTKTYSGLGLNKPQGLAFDGEFVWLADTNNDRLVKLSTGGALQASFGKPGKSNGFVPGAGLGEFNKPSAVAVSAEGAVFVADTNNSRVQVLEDGSWRSIPLPVPLGGVSPEPAGLALDQDGNLLVSDQANNRVLKLDSAGNLVSSNGAFGALPGQFDKPQGIAVSASGFVFVADRNNDRIQKFDRFGHVVAILGQNGKEPGQFNKPSSLALDAEGRLLVADSNNGRIQRLLPGSPSPAVVMVGKPKKVKQPVSDKGGKVKHPEGYKLDIPEGALAVQTAITIEPVKDPSLGVPAKAGQGKEALKGASEVLDLGPEGTRFSAPVLVSVPYDPNALGGMAENDLKLFTWNTQSLAWEKVEKSWVSVSSRAVFALLEHFSLYQVMGIQPEATTSSDFNFRDVYAFPNPARGVNPTFRAQVGTADSVDITIYDSSGRIVEKDSCGTGQVKDLGNGMGNQLTFECVWDAHRVGSGIYTYMVRARKAGFKDVTVVKKLGIVK